MTTETLVGRSAADAFADAVGESRANVRIVDPQWKQLLGACALVDVHVTCWPAETILTLDVLGLHAENEAEEKALTALFDLGQRLLLPKRINQKRQQFANRFRHALWRRSIPSHWGCLVPQQRYSEWKAEAKQIKAEFLAFVKDVYDHWDELEDEVRIGYVAIGHHNYRRLVSIGRAPTEPEDEWVANFVVRCMAKMEKRDYWLERARMWWDVGFIPLKAMLAEAGEDEIASVIAAAQAKTEMERDILLDKRKQIEQGLFQFVSDVRGEITSLVFNVMADVLTAVKKNDGDLPRNSSKQLRNLVDKVEGLKFWDDATLDARMAEIRSMLGVPSYRRDPDEMQAALRQIGAEARLLLVELDRPIERRTRHLGIPEHVEQLEAMVRQTRHTVAESVEVEAAPVRQSRRVEVAA